MTTSIDVVELVRMASPWRSDQTDREIALAIHTHADEFAVAPDYDIAPEIAFRILTLQHESRDFYQSIDVAEADIAALVVAVVLDPGSDISARVFAQDVWKWLRASDQLLPTLSLIEIPPLHVIQGSSSDDANVTESPLSSALPADRCDDSQIGMEAMSPGGFKLICLKGGLPWPGGLAMWWISGDADSVVADPTRREREDLYVAAVRGYSESLSRNWVDDLEDGEIVSRGWETCSLLDESSSEPGPIPDDLVFLEWKAVVASLEAQNWDDTWTAGEMVRLSMYEATTRLCPWYQPWGQCMVEKVDSLRSGLGDSYCDFLGV